MKSVIKLTILLVSLALLINSCSTKTYEEGKMIPKNASVIAYFNTKSLLSKLSWDEIKQTNWFKEIYNDTSVNPLTKKLMDNPAGTGIDLDAACVVFLQKNGDPKGQIVFEGTVKDAKTFETFNKTLDPGAVTVKDGDINLLTLKDKTVVGWNDKKFAYVTRNPGVPANMNFGGDGTGNNAPSYNAGPDLSLVCKKLFALTADSSMAKTEKFATLIKEDGDFHLWQNTEELIKGSAPMGALSMLKLDVFLKDNISTYTVSFDNGKIDVKQKYYVSTELTDVLKKYTEGGMNTDMVKNIPSQNLLGIIAIHFKPEGISEIVKLTGMDGIINGYLSKEGITIDDFVKAIKGDAMFAVTDFTMKRDSFNLYNKPDANFLFSVSIGDKPSFDKLMSAGKMLGGQIPATESVHSATNDKLFAIGNSQQYVSKYIQGSNTKFDFTDKIADHPFFAFADIQKILLTASSEVKDSGYKIIMDESIKTWQSFYSMGGEYKDGGFVSHTEIDLMDKNTNSLKQLNSYFDKIAKVMIEKNKENTADKSMTDSVTMDMPMDTSSITH